MVKQASSPALDGILASPDTADKYLQVPHSLPVHPMQTPGAILKEAGPSFRTRSSVRSNYGGS